MLKSSASSSQLVSASVGFEMGVARGHRAVVGIKKNGQGIDGN